MTQPPGDSLPLNETRGRGHRADVERLTDQELTEAVCGRDRLAFEVLYDRYVDLVYTVALRILQSPPEAETVVSDAFFELWSHPEKLDSSRGSCRTYLIVLARSRSIDRLRQRRVYAGHVHTAATLANGQSPTPHRPDSDLIQHEVHSMAKAALNNLRPDQAEAIRLAFFGGLTHREIADVLAEPLGTIKSRIRSGLEQLRTALNRLGVDSDGA